MLSNLKNTDAVGRGQLKQKLTMWP